jgi:hypothetical protein
MSFGYPPFGLTWEALMGVENIPELTSGETPIERAVRVGTQWRQYLRALGARLASPGNASPKPTQK